MKAAAVAILAALVIEPSSVAEASSCNGNGGSGDSGGSESGGSESGGSESGGSDSGGSDSASSTPACVDGSDVVGYRRCTGYGAWAANTKIPLLIFELGVGVQHFAMPRSPRDGTVEHDGERFAYRVSTGGGADRGNDPAATAVVTTARIGMGARVGLYGALELELGGVVAEPSRVEMTSTGMLGTPTIEQTSVVAMGALGVVGFQRGTDRVLLGAEVLGGVRAVSYNYESQYLACEQTDAILVGRSVMEARARASVFVTPMVSVGAQLGTGLIGERSWSAGVYVGGYTRAFATSR